MYLLASCIVTLIAIWLWWKRSQSNWNFEYNARELWRSALPMWGVASLSILMTWGVPLFLGVWAESKDVAVFHNAFRTSSLVMLVLMAINSIAAPKFSALHHQGDIESLKHIAIWSTRLMVLACIPVLGFILVFSEWIMGLFGPEFVVGAPVLVVLALGQFVNVATGSVGFLLSMTGHERYLLCSSGITAVVMVGLCVWLIPEYGVMGAAIAQAVSLSVQMLLNTWFVKMALGFVPMNIFSKT